MNYQELGYKGLMGLGIFSLFLIVRIVLKYTGTFSTKEIIFLTGYFIVSMICILMGRYMIYKNKHKA